MHNCIYNTNAEYPIKGLVLEDWIGFFTDEERTVRSVWNRIKKLFATENITTVCKHGT